MDASRHSKQVASGPTFVYLLQVFGFEGLRALGRSVEKGPPENVEEQARLKVAYSLTFVRAASNAPLKKGSSGERSRTAQQLERE